MIELKSYGINSHQGPHLNLNEDLAEADLVNKLFMVVDGFGGSNIGDRAAQIVRDSLLRSFTKIANDSDATLRFFYSHKYLLEGNALINAFFQAHQSVNVANESKSLDQKGGASVLAASLSDNILTLVSTGNCCAYLYRNKKIKKIMTEDSLDSVNRLEDEVSLTHIPASGMGLFEDFHFSAKEIKVKEGDVFFLLTDGAHRFLTEQSLLKVIQQNVHNDLSVLTEIFSMNNSQGNLDNQTGIILRF